METSSEVLQKRINKRILSVIHIGAGRCDEYKDYVKFRVKKVLWIDGNGKNLKDGMDIIKKNRITNQTSLNVYLSHKNGIETLYETANRTSGYITGRDDSLLKPCKPFVNATSTIEVNVRRLDDLFSELNIDASDYNTLVIDVQGAELKVLIGCGDIINHMNFIVCETWQVDDGENYGGEYYKNESNVDDLKGFLEKACQFKETARHVTGPWMDILFEKEDN